MMRTILIESALQAVKESATIRTGIAAAMGVHPNTVARWAKNNDPQLAHPDSIQVLTKWAKGNTYTRQIEQGDKHLSTT